MKSLLKKRSRPSFACTKGRVYAYENLDKWMSLDPFSPYRGVEGTKRIIRELASDYNADGNITLQQYRTDTGGEVTISYAPPIPRIEVKQDSVITTVSVSTPDGGSIKTRAAEPTKKKN